MFKRKCINKPALHLNLQIRNEKYLLACLITLGSSLKKAQKRQRKS